MLELLRTKLYIPRPRPSLVLRPRLSRRLNAGLERRLTLIAAPAGFGKTTLLGEWIPQSPHCVTWLALDEGDNDPTRFWTYFIASVQQIDPGLGAGALALLQAPQAPPIRAILNSLINDITTFPDRFATVLDDYHVIVTQSVHEALAYLIEHLPGNFHLVLATRIDPPIPLARLRARDELTEFRAGDLRFTAGEALEFLTGAAGLSLSEGEVAVLEKRTEGWVTGLQIAALSMQGRADIPAFIQAFSGSHRHILGYLAEEVLNQLPAHTLEFLLRTSILERLCAALCDAVTGETGAQAMLEEMEHANLFLTPLDDDGVWYRYHHLFAEVLQARLQRNRPEEVRELHRRAGRWYTRQGMTAAAVRHTLAGADFEEAARLIEGVAVNMLFQGASASLIRWLDAIPEEMLRTRPRLCLARGWTYQWGPMLDLDRADSWAQLADEGVRAYEPPDPGLTGEVAAQKAQIAAARGNVHHSRMFALEALDNLPPGSPWRSAVNMVLGTAHMDTGEMTAAAQFLEEALRLSQADGVYYIQMAAASFLADIQVFQGCLSRAMEMYHQVLAWADPNLPQKGGVMAHAGLAHILCERHQLEPALGHIQMGFEQLGQVGGAWAAHVLHRTQARLLLARGNGAEALETLDRSYQIGQNFQVGLVITQAAALRARVLLAQRDLSAAQAWADSGLLPELVEARHPGWREPEFLTLARLWLAQGRLGEALPLLDDLRQSAEAEERAGSLIEILILLSLNFQAAGDSKRAVECLERALILAEPEGYFRIFIEEGEPMRALLQEYHFLASQEAEAASLRLLAYTSRLLAAFSPPGPADFPAEARQSAPSPEPLTEREQEILSLLAQGLSNKEIADRLVIEVSTVKSHINHLYGKLGTHRRTQAIVMARDLGLLIE